MSSDPSPENARRYRDAAVAYFVYGVVYLIGAGHLGLTGASSRTAESGAWVWYAVGIVILVTFPWLIARGYVWFTRLIALHLGVRIYGLFLIAAGPTGHEPLELLGGASVSKTVGAIAFASVAAVAAAFLIRASWPRSTGTAS
jgi:hypothetical protein